ncbi:hypothetical protein [Streptomyces sp. NPDC005805]|uniref:hypothetical protein n=1 Tax=Streptomyces sp. NPDC005805 TaxID=3157068 RepID=UPI00340BB919
MADTTAQGARRTHDYLAGEGGAGIGQPVQTPADARPTAARRAERLAQDRETVRQVIGLDLSDEAFDQAPDVLGNIYRMAAVKARRAPGAGF